MTTIWATIDSADDGVSAVLAGEALREAAKARGARLELEIRRGETVLNVLDTRAVAPGDTWLAVGARARPSPALPC